MQIGRELFYKQLISTFKTSLNHPSFYIGRENAKEIGPDVLGHGHRRWHGHRHGLGHRHGHRLGHGLGHRNGMFMGLSMGIDMGVGMGRGMGMHTRIKKT